MITAETYCFSGFELDLRRARLRAPGGETVRLRPKSFDMLRFFAANPGRMIDKQELIEAVWPNVHLDEDSFFQCIRDIRTALGDEERQLIKSVSGRGYIFAAEVTAEPHGGDIPEARVDSAEGGTDKPPFDADERPAERIRAEDRDLLQLPAQSHRAPLFGRGWQFRLAAAAVTLCAVIGLAIAALSVRPAWLFARARPIVSVMPIVATSNDPETALMVADLTERLSDGLSKIGNIRIVRPRPGASPVAENDAGAGEAHFVVSGQLQRQADAWEVQAHMADAATGELLWATSFTVSAGEGDTPQQQYRLAGGIGYPLALRLNKILNEHPSGRRGVPTDGADDNSASVIEQATAFINHTTPERFQAAERMLAQALEADPGNVDLEVALASHRLRGVQLRWYPEAQLAEKEASTRAMLQEALRAKPSYLPALEAYCRLLAATNYFTDALVACAKTLSFDPWNGTALFEMGLSQIQLARFDDSLASFIEADRFDAPAASRWTWLLGAGWACLLLDRNEEASIWLERSIAITPGTGRSYLLLAVAYHRLGRTEDAKQALAKALRIGPDLTSRNSPLPQERTHPAFREASDRVMRTLVELGLPPG